MLDHTFAQNEQIVLAIVFVSGVSLLLILNDFTVISVSFVVFKFLGWFREPLKTVWLA